MHVFLHIYIRMWCISKVTSHLVDILKCELSKLTSLNAHIQ